MTRTDPLRVTTPAILLGAAGLLPALIGMTLAAWHHPWGAPLALAYAAGILSFLGGIWWGLAMRLAAGQARWAAIATIPSLVAVAIGVSALLLRTSAWPCVLMGSAILLTLPIDRTLTRTGVAPANWMRLRVPLSAGLGALTILAGVLAAR